MRRERLYTALWAAILGFFLSFSAVGCVVSAFSMAVDMQSVAWVCLGCSLLGAVCYSLPLGLVPAGVFAFSLGYFWQNGSLVLSVESLLFRISKQYHQGYKWPIIRWSGRMAEDMEHTLPLVLCLLGGVIAWLICRSVCRRKTAIPAVFLAFLCVGACFVVNDTVPKTAYLFLLFLSLITLLMTAGVRRRDEQQGNKLTALILPVTALCLLVLFACVPQESYSAETAEKLGQQFMDSSLMRFIMGENGQPVNGNTVDLSKVGYRAVGKNKILEVKTDFTRTLYLRGRALDYYDGVSWSVGENDELTSLQWPSALEPAGVVEISSKFAHKMLYVPYYATSKSMRESPYGVDNGQELTQYSFSTLKAPTNEELQRYQVDVYLEQLNSQPEEVKAWAEPLAREVTAQSGSFYEKAQRIAEYVRNSASYDTNTPRMGLLETDFARWFLEDSDTGYCVHFATATTVLLQASSVPARYVTGYTVQVVAGQSVEVTADMAHAWCEYWLPGFGWTVLESTPPDLRTQPTEPTVAENAVQPTQGQIQPSPQPNTKQPKTDWTGLWIGLWCLLALAGVWGQYRLRLWIRKRGFSKGDANAQGLTWWRYTEELSGLLGEAPPDLLHGLAQKAKFSRYVLTAEELAEFEDYATQAVKKLKKRPLYFQVFCRFILALY